MKPTQTRPVLYAEDEENDAFLMRRAFAKAGVGNPLFVVNDGTAAILYLAGEGEYSAREKYPLPCLLLLDLNMPRQSGLEVLKWVRSQTSFESLPVVILTSSSQDRDIRSAHKLGASGYLVKPASSEKLIELVAGLRDTVLGSESNAEGWLDIRGSEPPPKHP